MVRRNLRFFGASLTGDLDHLAVNGDHPGIRVDLPNGEGAELAPAQPAVGGREHHQLVPFATWFRA